MKFSRISVCLTTLTFKASVNRPISLCVRTQLQSFQMSFSILNCNTDIVLILLVMFVLAALMVVGMEDLQIDKFSWMGDGIYDL